jgi:hypothetical protein
MWIARPCYLCVALWLAGCAPGGEGPPIGEGFVAPATLNLRQELGPRQPSVATVQHGEKVEILAKRRRFVRIRAKSGAVGWIDGDLLFSPQQMEELRALGRAAARLPSQGEATVLDALNVHTHAGRQAPSFHQIREGNRVTVVAHRLVAAAPFTDDWSLVRVSAAEAGWVLTRMLFMAIPDEVAQYAEGQRITSYFSLGEIRDGSQVKQNWLWTTITRGAQPYEFDGARVFVWSQRRHRYETAFIERNLKGYYPIEVHKEGNAPASFSLILEEKDGARYRRTYAFQGYRVRLAGRTRIDLADPLATALAAERTAAPKSTLSGSFFARTWRQIVDFGRRLRGR